MPFSDTDFIQNPDGSVYHLGLHADEIADIVFLVGDPDRVPHVSRFFDRIDVRKQKREFVTHSGYLNNLPVSCVSTGIGPDNIDIVLNELDAAVNIDPKSREPRSQKRSLKLIRIGTSGAIPEDIPVDSLVVSEAGISISALMSFYEQQASLEESYLQQAFQQYLRQWIPDLPVYASFGDAKLIQKLSGKAIFGTTFTACGFYAPQGRKLNYRAKDPLFLDHLRDFRFLDHRITNIEMETAAIYGLGKLLGHQCLSVNVILANRLRKEFSKDPYAAIDRGIQDVIECIVKYD